MATTRVIAGWEQGVDSDWWGSVAKRNRCWEWRARAAAGAAAGSALGGGGARGGAGGSAE